MIDLLGKIVLLLAVLLSIRLYQIYKSPLLAQDEDRIYYPEQSIERLRHLIVSRKNILLSGSSGIDKSDIVKQATAAFKPNSQTVLVPIFVDLQTFTTENAVSVDGISAAFQDASNAYEVELLRRLRKDPVEYLAVFLNYHWKQLFTFTNCEDPAVISTIASSMTDINAVDTLKIVMDLSDQVNKLLFTVKGAKGKKIAPVLVIDEFQVLGKQSLQSARQELIKYLQTTLVPKTGSKLNCILISSENNSRKLVREWTTGLESLMFHEIISDLSHGDARTQLRALLEDLKVDHSDAIDDAGLNRMSNRVTNDTEFDRIFKKYGGYMSDLERLALAQAEKPAEDVHIVDRSRVQSFLARLDSELSELRLDSKHIQTVFRSIIQSSLSPRGAVAIADLVGKGVPETVLDRMATAGLIEWRESSPDVLDYVELKALHGDSYVVAPCPLAKESMARVIKRLTEKKGGSPGSSSTSSSASAGAAGGARAGTSAGSTSGASATRSATGAKKAAPKGKASAAHKEL